MKLYVSLNTGPGKPPKGWSVFKGDSDINKWGNLEYTEVFERTMFSQQGKRPYYLFIAFDGHNYYPGHGGVVIQLKVATAQKAAAIAEKWFNDNAEK